MCNAWTSERPTEKGFYWFIGWSTVSFRHHEPYLHIADFWSGGQCMIGGSIRYEHETLGLWKKIETPDVSSLTDELKGLRDTEAFSYAEASKGS